LKLRSSKSRFWSNCGTENGQTKAESTALFVSVGIASVIFSENGYGLV
jgi:hypothetical protein